MAEIQANGVRLHVQRLGQGPPTVLFLHGLVMDNLSSFYFTLANPVARVAEAVLFDLRGHGKSERPAAGYAVADFTADLSALAEGLSLAGPLHLVGNSFGGLLALAFAAAQPRRVASLVLIDAHVGLSGWAASMAQTLSLTGEARDRRISESFRHWLGRHSERKSSRLAETARALVERTSLVADLRGSPSLTPEQLRAIECPVLALYGERSDIRADAETLRDLVPHARLALRGGCSHSLLWEATPWVRDELLAWIGEQS
ncbi:MAG: alpha/beta fold hydrolase [Myxococcales bacterium]